MSLQARDILFGKDRSIYDQDAILRLALTHLVQGIGQAAPEPLIVLPRGSLAKLFTLEYALQRLILQGRGMVLVFFLA